MQGRQEALGIGTVALHNVDVLAAGAFELLAGLRVAQARTGRRTLDASDAVEFGQHSGERAPDAAAFLDAVFDLVRHPLSIDIEQAEALFALPEAEKILAP